MTDAPVNPNSVHLPLFQTGFLKAEYDTTYPVHLNGIISQEEFIESINRINHALVSCKNCLVISWVTFMLSISMGITFTAAGGGVSGVGNSGTTVSYAFLGVGVGSTAFGLVFFAIGCCIVSSKRIAQMRLAVAEESIKYSSRSSIPCSWRLESLILPRRGCSYFNRRSPTYNLVIDIHRPSVPENETYYSNQVAAEPKLFFDQQDSYPSPPYSTSCT